MSTIVIYLIGFLLCLAAASKIPGLDQLVAPLMQLIAYCFKFIMEFAGAWSLYFVKILFRAHWVYLKHLFLSPDQIDPTYELREQAQQDSRSMKKKVL